jgi:predicted lipoprotein with Yx(FWY)xxD motif
MNRTRNAVLRRSGWVGAIAAAATLSVIAVAVAAPIARLAGATTVTTHQTKRGKDLAASNGHALYLFVHDKGTSSTCYGACAKAWPPLLTKGAPAAAKGSGVNPKLLGTTKRTGGTVQVTYHGHPLYEYAKDTKPGQINGEGANQFGGHWYLVNTSGNDVKPKSGGGSVCDPLCPGY